MKNNFTIGLVVGALALGSYMYFVEAKKDAPTDSQEVAVWSLTENQAKDLSSLHVKVGDKEAKYVRDGQQWRLASEPKRDLDTANWDPAYNNLKNLMAQRKVEDKAKDLAKYGLAKPAGTLRWGDEKSPYQFEVGDKNPAGDAYYVHVAKDDAVYTVSTWKVDNWKDWATKPPLAALPSPSPKASASPQGGASPAPSPSKK